MDPNDDANVFHYDIQPAEEEQEAECPVPDYESEFVTAKSFLQRSSTFSGDNLYDHLTDVLNKILAERPENVIDFFEEYSRKVKEKRFKPLTDHLEDIYVSPGRYEMAMRLMPLLKVTVSEERTTADPEDQELADMTKNDMLQLLHYFEQAGVGLPRLEMYGIMLYMKVLIKKQPIAAIRFWGKIYGLYKNYLVVETELKEEEYMARNQALEAPPEEHAVADETAGDQMAEALETLVKEQEMGGEGVEKAAEIQPRALPPAPVIQYTVLPEPPTEASGVGVNKKVYYVCNEVGDEWVELPDVTPKQIRVARQICKSFTGNLDTPIIGYPEFPGTEKNYLRAQISRISAGTQISPLGFYTFGGGGEGGEDEEEEEEAEEAPLGEMKTTYKENPKYDPVSLTDLVDGSMSFWVHHTLYILPQGRTSWWNPNPAPEGEGEEMDEALGEEDEDKPKVAGVEPETGPPLLTPLSEDASLEAVPAWSARASSALMQEHAVAVIRSNLWPGAYCFATQGKLFQNIYLGSGLKYLAQNFSPLPLPPIQQEYPTGPEIMEITDPKGEDEEAWTIAHLPKPKLPKPNVEEGGEEEEEEEEEDDDD